MSAANIATTDIAVAYRHLVEAVETCRRTSTALIEASREPYSVRFAGALAAWTCSVRIVHGEVAAAFARANTTERALLEAVGVALDRDYLTPAGAALEAPLATLKAAYVAAERSRDAAAERLADAALRRARNRTRQ